MQRIWSIIKLPIRNNCIFVIKVINKLLFLKLIILENSLNNVKDPLFLKVTVHHHMLLHQFRLLMIDGVSLALLIILYFLHKDLWHVIRLSTKIVKKDLFQELLIMLRSMVLSRTKTILTAHLLKLLNNARKLQKISKNSKYQTIVLPKTNKTSSNKLLIMVQSLLLSQYTEISWFINQACIKSTQVTKSSVLAML